MSDKKINAQVLLVKCEHTHQTFGVRIQEFKPRAWGMTWAFPLSDKRASAEHYGTTHVEGSFSPTDEYPGCPYCGAMGFFRCGNCGKLTCFKGGEEATCAHCGQHCKMSGTLSDLDVGDDL